MVEKCFPAKVSAETAFPVGTGTAPTPERGKQVSPACGEAISQGQGGMNVEIRIRVIKVPGGREASILPWKLR